MINFRSTNLLIHLQTFDSVTKIIPVKRSCCHICVTNELSIIDRVNSFRHVFIKIQISFRGSGE